MKASSDESYKRREHEERTSVLLPLFYTHDQASPLSHNDSTWGQRLIKMHL